MAAIDVVNRVFRNFYRYTGDGKPGEPTNAPLPIGDPQSGIHNPAKSELRTAFLETLNAAAASADEAEAWAAAAGLVAIPNGSITAPKITNDLTALAAFRDKVVPGASTDALVYLRSATSAVSRSASDKLNDFISVKDFGAKGDGIQDDTAAIQATVNAAKARSGGIYFPPGNYRITSSVIVDYANFSARGASMWSSTIVTANQIDMFRFDFTARSLNFMEVADLGFLYDSATVPTNGSAIRMYDVSGAPQFGGSHHNYENLMLRNMAIGIVFDKAHLGNWMGINQIADFGHLMFSNIHIPFNADKTQIGILFRGGPGAHNTFRGGSMQVKTVGIRMGDGTTDGGLGDQLFQSLHILNGDYAIDLFGPTGVNRYNENVTITGCQFDGIEFATVRGTRLKNIRIKDCNSTSGATYDLNTCEQFSVDQTGTYESNFIFNTRALGSGATSVDLFDIAISLASDSFSSVYAEVFVDAFIGGVGNRPTIWRGFIRNSGGALSVHQESNYNSALGNSTLTVTSISGNTVARVSLGLSGSTSAGIIDAQLKILGRNHKVTVK